MTSDPRCEEIRLSLPELALGTLAGQERARVLEHLGSCAQCRHELQSLTEVGDELLLLAPSAEPPVGFESRVLDALPSAPARRSLSKRWILAAAAVLVFAAAVGGGAVYLVDQPDRELAQSYRRTLGVADGTYVAARPFVGGDGSEVGYVFGYQGSPSWIFCVVREGESGTYDIEVTTTDGSSVAGQMQVSGGSGTWHQLLEEDLHDLRSIRLIGPSTGDVFVARW